MGVDITKNRPSCVVLDYVANKRNHWPSGRFCERFQIQTTMHPASDCGARFLLLETQVTGEARRTNFFFSLLNNQATFFYSHPWICYLVVQPFDRPQDSPALLVGQLIEFWPKLSFTNCPLHQRHILEPV
jgi:hypothetical protein